MPERAEVAHVPSPVAELAKTGATLLGILYALGFAVVTIHLGRYHVAPFGLLRVQYLLAGLWLLAPLVGVVLPLLWAAGIYRVGVGSGSPPRSRSALVSAYAKHVVLALGVTASYVWVMGLVVFRVAPELRQEWGVLDIAFIIRYAGIVLLYVAALTVLTFTGWHYWREVRSGQSGSHGHRILMLIILTSFAIFTFIAYMLHFSINAYSRLPAVLGGGAAQAVILLPRLDSAAVMADQKAVGISGYDLLLVRLTKVTCCVDKLQDQSSFSIRTPSEG